MKIFAVVPTYNRPELIVKNIECLLKQTQQLDTIIVVDNGSNIETITNIERKGFTNHPRIKYVRIDENTGASGGFATGLRIAMEMDADWIWGMDDDAFPRPDALEKLTTANSNLKYDCLWSNVDEDHKFDSPLKSVDLLIFVGFFISKKLVLDVGYPDERYYMYHDDTDYSNRIIRKGYKIVKVQDSIIDHKGFDKRGNATTEIRTPLGTTPILNCEPYRIYYIFRNGYHIKNTPTSKLLYILKLIFLSAPKYLATRPISGASILLATLHILTGKRGKTSLPTIFNKKY